MLLFFVVVFIFICLFFVCLFVCFYQKISTIININQNADIDNTILNSGASVLL